MSCNNKLITNINVLIYSTIIYFFILGKRGKKDEKRSLVLGLFFSAKCIKSKAFIRGILEGGYTYNILHL